MRKLREIFRFELRHHLRSPVFWLAGILFFLLSFGAVTTDTVQIGGAIGNVHRNAPYVVMQFLLIMSVIGVFVTTAFVANAVLRDRERGTAEIFFSTPVRKRDYLLGRFGGALTVAALIFVWVALAIAVGSLMPWLEPERVGPHRLLPYAYSLGMLVFPNVLLTGAVFFGLATATRSMMATYGGVVAFFVGYAVAGNLLSDMESERLATLMDPFGLGAFQVATQYWTTAERNTRILGLDGAIVENRLLWLAVAVAALAVTYWRFSFTERAVGEGADGEDRDAVREETEELAALTAAPGRSRIGSAVARDFSAASSWKALLRRTRFEVRTVVLGLPFLVILALGALNLIGGAAATDSFFGTPVWPRTHLMIRVVLQSFVLFGLIILTFYSGELVWRDRRLGVDGVHDALPVPNWVYWGGKMAALVAISALILAVATLAAVGYQLWQGFTDIEPLLYLQGMGLRVGILFTLLGVLALFAQVATNHKYAGFLVMVVYFVALPVLDALDFDHNLYKYAQTPPSPYSDMNGFGHFVEPVAWFDAYWGFAAVILLTAVHLLWVRGEDTSWTKRLRVARQRFTAPVGTVLAVGVVGFVGTGGWIYYNTNVLNEYVPDDVREDEQARYERKYAPYEEAAQPTITSVYAEVDIHPYRRALDIRGRYRLRNKEDVPVDTLHLNWTPAVIGTPALDVPGAAAVRDDRELGWRSYALSEPLVPGDEMEISYAVEVRTPGFVNSGSNTDLVYNGTFFNNASYFPHIGYEDAYELSDPVERRRHGLPPIERMPPLEDSTRYDENYLTSESDWIRFETVVSTASDQVALAPGYLQREWEEGGRRYFHYAMDTPILGFWSYLSGKWAVARDRWRDVEIAVYHHPGHPYNVERMIEAAKASLEYYDREFGAYQHRQLRIVEFPRYASFAQSFPNTIPFSESIGFIARLEDPKDIDYPFYVTAHEVAHQWWAHQVVGANVQGATVTSETMAQYSALMVMEKEYGKEKMRRFLRYELDAYLEGRGGERIEELPLYRVENQPYIHYRKGSLATYALRDYIGEDAYNRAMARYVEDIGFSGPPYTTSAEYLDYLTDEVPEEHLPVVEDLFRTITLWELRARNVVREPTGDGRWRVRLDYEARKYRAGGQGEETEVPMDGMVDIVVFGAEGPGTGELGSVLLGEKRRITGSEGTIVVVVDGEPRRAGIDPFNKLIDRNPGNNVADAAGAGN